jgi:glycosyltransferase involved in cell wall biosynthesis
MPLVSIVICTYKREKYLPICLDHLKKQEASYEKFEVVIVDNNSKDNTPEICKKFIEENEKMNISYFLETNPGLSNARNRGITEAKGELIAFIDDDGYAKSDYVSVLIDILKNDDYQEYIAFGGKVEPFYNPGKKPKWISKYIEGVVSRVDLGEKIKAFDKKYPAGCNMIFRRSAFEKFGSFNNDLHTRGDDKYMFDKLKKQKQKVLYIPSLYVDHFIDDYRLEKKFIAKLSKIIGQSENIRLRNENFILKFLKFNEYVFKYFASLILSLGFILKGEFSKANYLEMIRRNVLLGYFLKD